MEAEGSLTWDDRSQILTIAPFIRIDPDNRFRTRLDFLDLVWEKIWNDWEVAIGMRQVSWGVAESAALVDVINQRDFGEDAAAPGRLGQPLLNLKTFTSLGSFEGYVLPYFRERRFAGRGAALWSPLPVDEDGAEFEHDRGREHIDWTLRWSHFVGGGSTSAWPTSPGPTATRASRRHPRSGVVRVGSPATTRSTRPVSTHSGRATPYS